MAVQSESETGSIGDYPCREGAVVVGTGRTPHRSCQGRRRASEPVRDLVCTAAARGHICGRTRIQGSLSTARGRPVGVLVSSQELLHERRRQRGSEVGRHSTSIVTQQDVGTRRIPPLLARSCGNGGGPVRAGWHARRSVHLRWGHVLAESRRERADVRLAARLILAQFRTNDDRLSAALTANDWRAFRSETLIDASPAETFHGGGEVRVSNPRILGLRVSSSRASLGA
jgi:hypothetical protein